MINVLTIGDVHIKVNNLPESEEMIRRLAQLAEERKPDFIVCMGDVLDRHSTIHVQCLMLAEKMVDVLSKIAPFFLVVGNHDRPNNSTFLTDEHPFNAMKKWNNVYIVDKVVSHTFQGHIDPCRFLFVPYVPPGKLDEALQTIDKPYENVTCYFTHQEIVGAKMGAIISQEGDKWSLENSLMVSGHIHDYDKLQDNMIYIGTPIQHSFGDKSDKTVSLFTFQEKDWKEERLDLGMIKKVTVYIGVSEIYGFVIPKDKLVKLVIRGDESEIKSVTKLEKIQEIKRNGVKVVFKTTPKTEVASQPTQKMTYRDRLYKELNRDLHLISWFNKIFS